MLGLILLVVIALLVVWAIASYNRLIGMPTFADLGMLYYRMDLAQKYGLSAPPVTWEQLEQQANTIITQPGRSESRPPDRHI